MAAQLYSSVGSKESRKERSYPMGALSLSSSSASEDTLRKRHVAFTVNTETPQHALTAKNSSRPTNDRDEERKLLASLNTTVHESFYASSHKKRKEEAQGRDKGSRGEGVDAEAAAIFGQLGVRRQARLRSSSVMDLSRVWYAVSWVTAGVVSGILKILFCIVFATVIHDAAPVFKSSLPLGIAVQLASSFVTCFITAWRSSVGVSVAGPDITPAIFLGQMAITISDEVCGETTKSSNASSVIACPNGDATQALATLLFMYTLTCLAMSISWILLANYRLTRIVDFLPVSVVSGFLGCIGYKILKEAIKISVGKYWYEPGSWEFWKLLLPVLPIGVPIYF